MRCLIGHGIMAPLVNDVGSLNHEILTTSSGESCTHLSNDQAEGDVGPKAGYSVKFLHCLSPFGMSPH